MNRTTNHIIAAAITATLAAALSVPPLRSVIEQSMAWHMVVQMPLLVVAGALAASAPASTSSGICTTMCQAMLCSMMLRSGGIDKAAANVAVKAALDFRIMARLPNCWLG